MSYGLAPTVLWGMGSLATQALRYGQKQRDPHKKIPELVRDDYIGISRRHVEGRSRETSSYFFIAIQDFTGSYWLTPPGRRSQLPTAYKPLTTAYEAYD